MSKRTIWRWIANFAQDNPEVPTMKQRKVQTTKPVAEPDPRQELPDDVKALQAELARVKEELRKEKLRADAYDTMSAKHANLRLNNTDFKELLFYGVRAVA